MAPVNFSATSFTIVDSEWITNLMGLQTTSDDWMHSYWSGDTYGKVSLDEVLCSGIGIIDEPNIRRLAYEEACLKHPLSSKILSYSAAAFFCGHETVGDIVPGLLLHGDDLVGDYYLDMRAFTGAFGIDFAACIQECRRQGAHFPYNPLCDSLDTSHLPGVAGGFRLKLLPSEIAAFRDAFSVDLP